MKTHSWYDDEIRNLNKKKEQLTHEEYLSLLFECPALRAEKLAEIKQIEEKVKVVEEDKWKYANELKGI